LSGFEREDGKTDRIGVRKATAIAWAGAGLIFICATVLVPVVALYLSDEETRELWALIGQAVAPIGILYSGIAILAIVITLLAQRRELQNQREELRLALEDQRRSSEIALRQLHVDLIRMAIDDPELAEVWPPIAPGVPETRKDHYCNLILNLQKVAYEAGTIEEKELKGVLRYLMQSHDMYSFWTKARRARVEITAGDPGEDYFTAQVDEAYSSVHPPRLSLGEKVRRRLRRLPLSF